MRERGKVKFYDAQKGYGFVTRDDNTDWFMHASQVNEIDQPALDKGVAVEFTVGKNSRSGKTEAQNIRIIEEE